MQDSSPASRTSQSSCNTYERQRRTRIAHNNLRVKQLGLVELTSCATRQLQHLTATHKRCSKRQVLPAGSTRQSSRAALLPKPLYCEYTSSEDEMSGEGGTYSPSADVVTAEEIETKELLVYLTKTPPTDAFAQKHREAYECFASYVVHTG